jgi:hypothetical protein
MNITHPRMFHSGILNMICCALARPKYIGRNGASIL